MQEVLVNQNNVTGKLRSGLGIRQIAEQILTRLGSENSVYISGLQSSSVYYFLSCFNQITGNKILVISNDEKQASQAKQELSYFTDSDIVYMPKKKIDATGPLFASDSDVSSLRSRWLHMAQIQDISICECQTLIEKFMPSKIYKKHNIDIKVKDNIDRPSLENELRDYGYTKTDFVQKYGEFSRRGTVVDVYSPFYKYPIRIEFFGSSVHSLRFFDSANQITINRTKQVTIIPATELIFDKENIEFMSTNIKKFSNENGVSASYRNSLLHELKQGHRPEFINWLAPFCFKSLESIFDYIDTKTVLLFFNGDEQNYYEKFIDDISEKLQLLRNKYKVIPDLDSLYLSQAELYKRLSQFRKIYISDSPLSNENRISLNFEKIEFQKSAESSLSPIDELARNLKHLEKDGFEVRFVLKTKDEIDKLKEITEPRQLKNISFGIGDIKNGFISNQFKIAVITENEIYRQRKISPGTKNDNIPSAFITSFSELKRGDYIVHKDFGIGLYKGLKQLDIKGKKADYLVCEYKDGDKIYVPVDKLNIVQRYVGEGKTPIIDKLGKDSWAKKLRKVKKSVELVAKDLLQLYARRKAEKGYMFSKNDKLYDELEATFQHEETAHQASAINDVMTDMESDSSMDRLICGDVGFGKTEVAIRAAFKAVMDGKQVAVIVPTTLLCFQHFLTFNSRLKDFPINIEMISRFRTSLQANKILDSLCSGGIDIIIGTHKLLGEKVVFKDLGLIIVDEEHKFGVKQKEHIRKIKSSVDVLTLSATPIPRTLQLSLANIRDISLINTPPAGRQQIETYVYHFSENIIRKAIVEELNRGGAIFFIHNRIENIHSVAKRISEIVPEVKYEITHGRMRESVLEKSIRRFINGEIDLLITTTIVESGLDIPRANTIIVNDAHTFGLADLYQLRGRVGRADKKAYAYFLVPGSEKLTESSKKRLKAVSELKELGSGFKLALSDLEIRGAGTLFGTEQSGHIGDIGLEMYLEMLESAVRNLSNQKQQFQFEPEIKSSQPTFIPTEYIEDDSERLMVYKRLASAKNLREPKELYHEIVDRFGKAPVTLNNLFSLIEIKIYMKKHLIKKIDIKPKSIVMEFLESSALFDYFRPSGIYRINTQDEINLKHVKNIVSSFKPGKPPYLIQTQDSALH